MAELRNLLRPSIFKVNAYRCRCGHEWVPKDLNNKEKPRVCPKCKSPNWDRPYKLPRPQIATEPVQPDPVLKPQIAKEHVQTDRQLKPKIWSAREEPGLAEEGQGQATKA